MARRRLTVKRIDPWSVLKFGAVVNVALLGVGLLVLGVIFFIVERLQLIDQVCDLALQVGFTACGLNVGNLFRAFALLGLLGVIILTAVLVFLSFLHNLIADLTGGLALSVIDDSPAPARGAIGPTSTTSSGLTGRRVDPTGVAQVPRTDRPAGAPPVPPIGSDRPRRSSGGSEVIRADLSAPRARDDISAPRARDDDADRTASLEPDEVDSGELFGRR